MKTNDQVFVTFVRAARAAKAQAAALWERIFVAKEWTDPDGWSLPGRAEACHLYDAHQQAEAQALASLAAWMRDGSEGPHPGGWLVTCHRASDGNVMTLWRHGRQVATLASCPLPVMIDPATAEAEYQAGKAWRRQRQAEYEAARQAVIALIRPGMRTGDEPWTAGGLEYQPGQQGGVLRVVGTETWVAAARAIQRAIERAFARSEEAEINLERAETVLRQYSREAYAERRKARLAR